MFCSKCGTECTSDKKFCPNCGAELIRPGEVSEPMYEDEVKGEQKTVLDTQQAIKKLNLTMLIVILSAAACVVISICIPAVAAVFAILGIILIAAYMIMGFKGRRMLKKLYPIKKKK